MNNILFILKQNKSYKIDSKINPNQTLNKKTKQTIKHAPTSAHTPQTQPYISNIQQTHQTEYEESKTSPT